MREKLLDIIHYHPTGHNVFSFILGTVIGIYKFAIQGFSTGSGTLGFINVENTIEVAWFALIGGFCTAIASSLIRYIAKKTPLLIARLKIKNKSTR